MLDLPLWAKLLACDLTKQPLVTGVKLCSDHILVCYATRTRERYFWNTTGRGPLAFSVTKRDLQIKSPQLLPTYEAAPGISGCRHIGIKRKHFRKLNLISQRLALHQLLLEVYQDCGSDLYPESCIRRDLSALQNINCARFWSGGALDFFASAPHKASCWRLLEHFFPDNERLELKPLRAAIFRIARQSQPLTTEYIRRYARWFCGRRRINPFAYCAVLAQMPAGSLVLDLHPQGGHKAVACGLLGLRYRTLDTIPLAKEREAERILNLDWSILGGEQIDLVICDGRLQSADIDAAKQYLNRSKHLLGWCVASELRELKTKINPRRVIPTHTIVRCRNPTGYFLWW